MKASIRYFALLLALTIVSAAGPQIFAAGKSTPYSGERVLVESGNSFEAVSSAVESLVAKNGMMVMTQVDQGKMLSMTGLQLKAKLFLIGNPTVGKQLFEQNQGVGLYVPLRIFVFTNDEGKTFVSYDRPSSVLGQFQNEKLGMAAKMLDEKLEGLATMAAQ